MAASRLRSEQQDKWAGGEHVACAEGALQGAGSMLKAAAWSARKCGTKGRSGEQTYGLETRVF